MTSIEGLNFDSFKINFLMEIDVLALAHGIIYIIFVKKLVTIFTFKRFVNLYNKLFYNIYVYLFIC